MLIVIGDHAYQTVSGTVTDSYSLQATTTYSILYISSAATFQGGGTISMGDSSRNSIQAYNSGAGGSATLTNVDYTISGSGAIGYGYPSTMTIDNQSAATIDATGATTPLVVSSGVDITNEGLLESTGAAGLQIDSSGSIVDTVTNTGTIDGAGAGALLLYGSAVDNDGGIVEATGTNGKVQLESGAVIRGGTLQTSGGGIVETVENTTNSGKLDGTASTLTTTGSVVVSERSTLTLAGSISNSGTIAVGPTASTSTATILSISGVVTLSGGGAVALGDFGQNAILGAANNGIELDNVDNTISGAGTIGFGSPSAMTLANESGGTLDATGTSNALIISSGVTMTNAGLIESTGTAGLQVGGGDSVTNTGTINASGSGALVINNCTVTNTGGTIEATGASGVVTIEGGTSISGGQLTTSGGQIKIVGSNNTLNGVTFTGVMADSGSLIFLGTGSFNGNLTGSGSLQVGATGNLTFSGTSGLTGTVTVNGGTLELSYGASVAGPVLFGTSGGTAKDDETAATTFTGGTGFDTISFSGLVGTITIAVTNSGMSVVKSAGGTDTLAAIDRIVGTTGNDTATYFALTTAPIVVNMAAGTGTVTYGTKTVALSSIESIVGTSLNDVFVVDNAESVSGGAGFNVVVEQSSGVTAMLGSAKYASIQEFIAGGGTNFVTVSETDGDVTYLYGGGGGSTNHLGLGSGGGFMISTGGSNDMYGSASAATDVFIGGAGGSTMHGGSGANVYYIGAGDSISGAGTFNTVVELAQGVTVSLGASHVQEVVLNGGSNTLDMTGSTDFVYLYGGGGTNSMTLGAGGGYELSTGGINHMFGGTSGVGTDVFVGGVGATDMHGGTGNNVYYVGASDTVAGAGGYNTLVELAQSVVLTLGSAGLTGIQQFILNGGTNALDASAATTQLIIYGGGGDDTIKGGTGNDYIWGEGGANTFQFGPDWGADTIVDWAAGTTNAIDLAALASLGVHAIGDITQTITGGNDVITSSHTGANSITLMGLGSALTAASFHFA